MFENFDFETVNETATMMLALATVFMIGSHLVITFGWWIRAVVAAGVGAAGYVIIVYDIVNPDRFVESFWDLCILVTSAVLGWRLRRPGQIIGIHADGTSAYKFTGADRRALLGDRQRAAVVPLALLAVFWFFLWRSPHGSGDIYQFFPSAGLLMMVTGFAAVTAVVEIARFPQYLIIQQRIGNLRQRTINRTREREEITHG